MENGQLAILTAEEEAEFLRVAQPASIELLDRAGMHNLRDRGWKPTA
jgi:hypothetical protein